MASTDDIMVPACSRELTDKICIFQNIDSHGRSFSALLKDLQNLTGENVEGVFPSVACWYISGVGTQGGILAHRSIYVHIGRTRTHVGLLQYLTYFYPLIVIACLDYGTLRYLSGRLCGSCTVLLR